MIGRPAQLLSLFSGCGGFDIGFLRNGFNVRLAVDFDRDAVENYSANLHSSIDRRDLTLGLPDDRRFRGIDLLIAGPPCQGFSTAGKRRIDDERNVLLPLTARIAKRIMPKVVVVENVGGAIAGDHASYWNELTSTFRGCGYKTHSLSINTTEIGMAQMRRRVFMFAWRTGTELDFRLPRRKAGTLGQVLEGVDGLPNHECANIRRNTDMWKIASAIKPGQKLSNVRGGDRAVHTWDIPNVFGEVTPQERTLLELLLRLRRQNRSRSNGDADPVSIERLSEAFGAPFQRLVSSLSVKGYICYKGELLDLRHTFNGKFRRLTWDKPSCTVDTRFGQPRYFLHPNKNRGFTVREAARIQGFPDNFVFRGDVRSQFRLVGNAVPPPLAQTVSMFVRYLLRN